MRQHLACPSRFPFDRSEHKWMARCENKKLCSNGKRIRVSSHNDDQWCLHAKLYAKLSRVAAHDECGAHCTQSAIVDSSSCAQFIRKSWILELSKYRHSIYFVVFFYNAWYLASVCFNPSTQLTLLRRVIVFRLWISQFVPQVAVARYSFLSTKISHIISCWLRIFFHLTKYISFFG